MSEEEGAVGGVKEEQDVGTPVDPQVGESGESEEGEPEDGDLGPLLQLPGAPAPPPPPPVPLQPAAPVAPAPAMAQVPPAVPPAPVVQIPLLNDNNYVQWAQKMELLLVRDDLWQRTQAPPQAGDVAEETQDHKAKAAIGLAISEDLLVYIRGLPHAIDYWNTLRDLFARPSMTSSMVLTRKLWRSRLEPGGDLRLHLRAMQQTLKDLEAVGEQVAERLKVFALLNSLDETWDSFALTLESIDPQQLTVTLVVARLLEEEDKRADNQREREFRRGKNNASGKQPQKQPRSESQGQVCATGRECWVCGSTQHLAHQCPKKKGKKKKPQGEQGKGGQGRSQKPPAQHPKASIAFVTSAEKRRTRESWLLDSGASHHIVTSADLLTSRRETDRDTVALADGTTAPVECIGEVFLPRLQTTLRDVLCVPTMSRNLLSLGTLQEDGFTVTFQDDVCALERGDLRVAVPRVYRLFVLGAQTAERPQAEACFNQPRHGSCGHLWHLRLNHLNHNYVRKTAELVRGIDLKDCHAFVDCEVCKMAKSHRASIPKFSTRQSETAFQLIHTDLIGPLKKTAGGSQYCLTLVDDATRYCYIFLLRQKSEAFNKIRSWVRWVERRFGCRVVAFQSDRGGEFLSKEMSQWLEREGITHRLTAPRTPEHNGVAERKNGELQTTVRALLEQAKLPRGLWGEAMRYSVFVSNRVYHRSINGVPYTKLYGKLPNLAFLRTFGSFAFVHADRETRRKDAPRAKKLQFIGVEPNCKALRFLNPDHKTVTISSSYDFSEQNMLPDHTDQRVTIPAQVGQNGGETELESSIPEHAASPQRTPQRQERPPVTPARTDRLQGEGGEETSPGLDTSTSSEEATPEPVVPTRRILPPRATRGVPPQRLTYLVEAGEVPETYQDVLELPQAQKEEWLQAIQTELRAMHDLQVFEPAKLPPGKHAIDSRWVFVLKDKEGAEPLRKARLVVRGCKQIPGVDFEETYSPTLSAATLRAALAVAGSKGFQVQHFDVGTAYLHAQLKEEVYITIPPGVQSDYSHFRLRKAVYGLRQSGRSWHLCLKEQLGKLGFTPSKADPCLFRKGKGDKLCFLLCFVDDLLVIAKTDQQVKQIAQELQKAFTLKCLGPVSQYLGVEIERTADGTGFLLSQKRKIQNLLKVWGMQDCKTVATPMVVGRRENAEESAPFPEQNMYLSLLGSLTHLACWTRPDIGAAVNYLSRKAANPTQADWIALKRILRYLKGTIDFGYHIAPKGTLQLEVFADSDFGGDETRKSTTGYTIRLGECVVDWGSHKQKTVACSTLESEYTALSHVTNYLHLLRQLMSDLDAPQKNPIRIWMDNQSAIQIAGSEKVRMHSKHVDIKHQHVREAVQNGDIEVIYCPSQENIADILTKPLPAPRFREATQMLNLAPKDGSLRNGMGGCCHFTPHSQELVEMGIPFLRLQIR